MKIKHIWSVLCKESVLNQDDNLISIFGVLEELKLDFNSSTNSGSLPEKLAIPLHYEIVSMWFKEKKDESAKADLEFVLISPSGKELSKITQTIEIPTKMKRFRSRVKVSGFQVVGEGDYIFEVKIKEEGAKDFILASTLPLEVKVNVISPKN